MLCGNGNTLIYMIQIPIMLGLALMFAQVIGSRFVLYKRNPKKPVIDLK